MTTKPFTLLASLLLLTGCVAPIGPQVSPTPAGGAVAPAKREPVILALDYYPKSGIGRNDAVTFTLKATDQDGRPLDYTWAATKGTLSANAGQMVNWRPVKQDGSLDAGAAAVTVLVSNGERSTTASMSLLIQPDGQVVLDPKPAQPSPAPVSTPVPVPSPVAPSPVITPPPAAPAPVTVVNHNTNHTNVTVQVPTQPAPAPQPAPVQQPTPAPQAQQAVATITVTNPYAMAIAFTVDGVSAGMIPPLSKHTGWVPAGPHQVVAYAPNGTWLVCPTTYFTAGQNYNWLLY